MPSCAQRPARRFDPAIVEHFAAVFPLLSPPAEIEPLRMPTPAMQHARPATSPASSAGASSDAFEKIALANQENYTLYEIAKAMGRSLSLDETMTLISSRVSSLLPFSTCVLFVRDGNQMLRCRFASGLHAEVLEKVMIKEGVGLSGWVARHGKPLVNGLASIEFAAAGLTETETRSKPR